MLQTMPRASPPSERLDRHSPIIDGAQAQIARLGGDRLAFIEDQSHGPGLVFLGEAPLRPFPSCPPWSTSYSPFRRCPPNRNKPPRRASGRQSTRCSVPSRLARARSRRIRPPVSDIFISYANEDRSRVRPLADALSGHGWSVWWDREIPAGRTFDQVIAEALAGARCVLVVRSRDSVRSDWCAKRPTRAGSAAC